MDDRKTTAALAFIITLCLGVPAVAQQGTPQQTGGKSPVRIVVAKDKDGSLKYNSPEGVDLRAQIFFFDTAKKALIPAASGSPRMTVEGVPVPVSFNAGGTFSTQGLSSPIYANTVWESKGFANLAIFVLYSGDGKRLAGISLNAGATPRLFVSSDYLVAPDDARQVDKQGPFVSVVFELQPSGTGASVGASRLLVQRNGKLMTDTSIDAGKPVRLDLDRVRSSADILDWAAVDAQSKTKHAGALGFPIAGSRAGIVSYRVVVPAGPSK